MHTLRGVLAFLIAVQLFGCTPTSKDEGKPAPKNKKRQKKEGLVKMHRPDGSLKSTINYKDGQKDGEATSYYKSGKVRQKINYQEGVKHGIAETYYENGNIYQRTPYDNGRKHGVRKRFRQNGQLYSEMPYDQDRPTIGLKEYTTSGGLKKKYPEIIIESIDQILANDSYVLRISMSEGYKKVEYYIGELTEGKYIGNNAIRMVSQRPGVLELRYDVPRGTIVMDEPNIIAKVTTKLKNTYITQKKHNVAVENRGY